MPSPSPFPRQPRIRAVPDGPWLTGFAVTAAFAALASYGLHHIGPLEEHLSVAVLLALIATSLVAMSIGAALAPPPLPAPVVVLGGRPPVISDLAAEQARFCAALHASALPHGFFVSLGPRFLRRYYRSFTDSPHAVALMACVDGHPVGFLVGPVRARAHRRWVVRNRGLGLAFSAVAALSVRPGLAAQFARTRFARYRKALGRGADAEVPASDVQAGDVAVLSHVAVLPGARHTGAGTTLVTSFERAARDAGTRIAYLTTIEGRDGAGPFYERLGWSCGPIHPTPEGRRMQEWTRTLDPEAKA